MPGFFDRLQDECRKEATSVGSNTTRTTRKESMPVGDSTTTRRKGFRGWNSLKKVIHEGSERKRHGKNIADDLVCPITLELPFDPCMAMDGRVYERAAIEAHMKARPASELKSPYTNVSMDSTLLPATQHKNIIETLIENGDITGPLADRWNERVEEKKKMDCLMKKAVGGDAKSMAILGCRYRDATEGFPKDKKLAFQWTEKAHEAGNVSATARLGGMLCDGNCGERDPKKGIILLGIAAGRGSDYAAYRLGLAFADGKYGLKVDEGEARRWLQSCLSDACSSKTLIHSAKDEAQNKLDELAAE